MISGCGLSWSGQQRRTWVRVLRFVGANIEDLGGPAVSNQWILNKCCLGVLDQQDVMRVIVQLTTIGKLDVEISDAKRQHMVDSDSMRNFVLNGVWPSSMSQEHASKQLWHEWLHSPGLEIQDLRVKLRLLAEVCASRSIELVVLQGYAVPWQQYHGQDVLALMDDPDITLHEDYLSGERYQWHDHDQGNAVPELGWQLAMAHKMCMRFWPDLAPRVQNLCKAFHDHQ